MGGLPRTLVTLLQKRRFTADPYGTHAPFLKASIDYLVRTRKPEQRIVMFEVGTGGLSSKIFQSVISTTQNSLLVSIENDESWIATYKRKYPVHDNWNMICESKSSLWNSILAAEVKKLSSDDIVLSFIDSSPWESRFEALQTLKERSNLIVFHDVDYFPSNGYFGRELSPIRNQPRSFFRYGNLKRANLGLRNYDDVFSSWVEVFPLKPGWFTGPPTLIGSNSQDVSEILIPRKSIIFMSNQHGGR
jgi:hypothetical protein